MPLIIGGIDHPLNKYRNINKFPEKGDQVKYEGEQFVVKNTEFLGGVSLSSIMSKKGKIKSRIKATEMYYITPEELRIKEKVKNF